VPALVLGAGCYALPLRFWGLDLPIVLLVFWLLGTSAVSFIWPRLAHRALRLGALALLVVGAVLLALFALSFAFLSGVHGSFGDLGEILMGLVIALVVPYALVYPVLELSWLGSAKPRALSSAPESTQNASGEASAASKAADDVAADGQQPEVGG
jgi:hypothetical protein